MSTKIRFPLGRVWLEVDANTPHEAIKQIAEFATVFGEQTCAACKSTDVAPDWRKDSEGHEYYSMRCNKCHAQLRFGQRKVDRMLFPRRQDFQTNEWLEHNGWVKWKADAKQDQPAPPPPSSGGPPPEDVPF